MNGGELLILLALTLPLFAAVMIYAVGRMPDVRETLTLVACIGLAIVAISIFVRVGQGDPPALTVAEPLPGLAIAFRVEPLGALFAVMASVLWGVNSLFSIGYMRGRREAHQTRFYICFALAMFGVMGIAFAANLFTLPGWVRFVFASTKQHVHRRFISKNDMMRCRHIASAYRQATHPNTGAGT